MKRDIERVLVVHNEYQLRGGEDVVIAAESQLLRQSGYEVENYVRRNAELKEIGRFAAMSDTLWNRESAAEVDAVIERFRPDIVHVHNTFMRISPSVYWTAARRRLPVVQTLHNFRFLCPQGMLLREHKVCEDCVGKLPWRSVVHRCYRESRAQSAVATLMLAGHRTIGTYRRKITRFIALNKFAREIMMRGGLPGDRIDVKSNFVNDPGPVAKGAPRQGILFVGRLSQEKGIDTLREAALRLPEGIVIDVIGDGPSAPQLQGAANVRWHGWQSPEEVIHRMKSSQVLLVPSLWYETGPQTVLEAYACGLPVVASRLGPLAAVVREGITGRLFAPGDPGDLARTLEAVVAAPQDTARMGEAARTEYERLYTPQRNHEQLMAIYRAAQEDIARAV